MGNIILTLKEARIVIDDVDAMLRKGIDVPKGLREMRYYLIEEYNNKVSKGD